MGDVSRREFAVRGGMAAAGLLLGPGARRVAALAPAGSRAASWVPSEALLKDLPRLLELAMVPGIAVAVLEGGRTWQRGFGLACREPERPVGSATLFEGASLGKPVFAAVVLRLRDAGVLDLDRPLHDYLRLPDADGRTRRITARHVLSNTTGLPNWRLQPGPLRSEFDPGKKFAYSGEGFFYLQRVIEQLTGTSTERTMAEHLFVPLGMTSSSYAWRQDFGAIMAKGYDSEGEVLEVYADMGRRFARVAGDLKKPMHDWMYADMERAMPAAFPDLPVLPVYMMPNAAGSFLTTVSDYSRFLGAVVEPGNPFLSARSRGEMVRPAVSLNSALSWGLGWGIEASASGPLLWHWGANGTFRNFVLVDTAGRRAVAVFCNSANGPKVYERIISEVTGGDHPAFLWFQV